MSMRYPVLLVFTLFIHLNSFSFIQKLRRTTWNVAEKEIVGRDIIYPSSIKEMLSTSILNSMLKIMAVGLAHAFPSLVLAVDDYSSTNYNDELNKGTAVARSLNSDEFVIRFDRSKLDIGLVEKMYKGFPVVTVNSVKNKSLIEAHPELREGAIIVAVGGTQVDGTSLQRISELVADSPRPLDIQFRDPSRFFELLDSTKDPILPVITTSYLPANARDANTSEQIIRVQRLSLPGGGDSGAGMAAVAASMKEQQGGYAVDYVTSARSARLLDVMEIQYVAQVDGSSKIVDSSADKAPPGSSAQSIYYVLGQRNGPAGFNFPPGWDLTLRGMVVGERRRITLPYTLIYDRKTCKALSIPPYQSVAFTVKLLSLT